MVPAAERVDGYNGVSGGVTCNLFSSSPCLPLSGQHQLARQTLAPARPRPGSASRGDVGGGVRSLERADWEAKTERAGDEYNRLNEVWRNADPELRPIVRHVRQRIARLVGER